ARDLAQARVVVLRGLDEPFEVGLDLLELLELLGRERDRAANRRRRRPPESRPGRRWLVDGRRRRRRDARLGVNHAGDEQCDERQLLHFEPPWSSDALSG